MKTTAIFAFFILVNALLSGCTIEKRLFNKGYHVEWNRKFKRQVDSNVENHEDQTDEVVSESDEEQSLDEKSGNELAADTFEITHYAGDAPVESQYDGVSNTKAVKEKKPVSKPVQKEKNKPVPYDRGGGGNVLLGLCTLVMICICMAMISYLFSAEATAAGILLILCFGWILFVFTIILIVIFIVRFIRNF